MAIEKDLLDQLLAGRDPKDAPRPQSVNTASTRVNVFAGSRGRDGRRPRSLPPISVGRWLRCALREY